MTTGAPEWRAALAMPSAAAVTRARRCSSRSQSPTATTSIGMPTRSSTAAAAASTAATRRRPARSCGLPKSQVRSSRSWLRARRTDSAWSLERWISASVCSTESCRCAATSARSSERMRSRRSSPSWRVRRSTSGPSSSTNPPPRTLAATTRSSRFTNASLPARIATIPPTTSAPPRRLRSTATGPGRRASSAPSSGPAMRPARRAQRARSRPELRVHTSPDPIAATVSGHTITSAVHQPMSRRRKSSPTTTSMSASAPRGVPGRGAGSVPSASGIRKRPKR